jgi:kynurenine formamidase
MGDANAKAATNWGRWGPDDQIGALNLITTDVVRDSASLIAEGRVISLARVIRHDIVRVADRPGPTHILTVDGGDYAAGAKAPGGAYVADDFIAMPLATGTHIDALAHVWSADGLYNGHDANLVRSRGAKVCGIENVAGVVTSAVLADIPRLHGMESLPPSHVITVDELEAATAGNGAPVQSGDGLLLRTGWLTTASLAAHDPSTWERNEPGIGAEAVEWIARHDVALVGADTLGVEVLPAEDGSAGAPLHVRLLCDLGVHLVELLDLETLAAAEPKRFMLVIAPLRIRGAINSPVNPLAIL